VNDAAQPTPPREELLRLLARWRVLAAQQTDAIRAGNWRQLGELAVAREQLQRPIHSAAAREATHDSASTALLNDTELQRVVGGLTALEQHNAQLLAAQASALQAEIARLGSVTDRLRLVRGAYAHASPNNWHSYS
jgi:hypothetical protein